MTDLIICIVLGLVSFIMAQIISISQIVSLIRTKNTSGVSAWTYFIFIIAGIFCLAWGFSYYFKNMLTQGDPGIPIAVYQWGIIPILCYYITDFSMSTTMFIIKVKHMRLAKKLNMSELDLAKYLVDGQNDKYLKSGRKLRHHINFPIFVLLGIIFTVIILFATLFTLYAIPKNPTPEGPGWPWVLVLSMLAAVLWEAISWPQFIKSIRQKDTSGISLMWAIFMPVSLTVSFSYALALACKTNGVVPDEGFSYDTIGALVFNGMIVNYGILIIKLINRRKAKKLGLTEIEYSKQVLIPAWKKKQADKAAKKAAKVK